MRIMGIDPGSQKIGIAIVEDGVLVRSRQVKLRSGCRWQRLIELYSVITEEAEFWLPDVLAIEEQFVGKNPMSALAVAESRGACIVAACRLGARVLSYHNGTIKKAFAGTGKASKEQMKTLASALSGHKVKEDEADAIAIALTGWRLR